MKVIFPVSLPPRHRQKVLLNFGTSTSSISFWQMKFASRRLRASQFYSDSDSWLTDKTWQVPCLWQLTCSLGPSTSSARLFIGSKLTHDLHQLTGHQNSVLLKSVTGCFLTFQTNVVPPSSKGWEVQGALNPLVLEDEGDRHCAWKQWETVTQCNITEDSNPYQHCCGDLKPHLHVLTFAFNLQCWHIRNITTR